MWHIHLDVLCALRRFPAHYDSNEQLFCGIGVFLFVRPLISIISKAFRPAEPKHTVIFNAIRYKLHKLSRGKIAGEPVRHQQPCQATHYDSMRKICRLLPLFKKDNIPTKMSTWLMKMKYSKNNPCFHAHISTVGLQTTV